MAMTNAEWCIKNNIKFQEIHVPYDTKAKEAKIIYRNKEIGRSKICDTSFAALKAWLDMEHVEPILDGTEKRYLAGVIRPFRNRFVFAKKDSKREYEHIIIAVKSVVTSSYGDYFSYIELPLFEEGTMYKGMKSDKAYTLEELGL